MGEILSITAKEKEIEINSYASDRVATLVRGIVGVAPYVGPMLAEAITSVIPNQKLDRIITFIKVLNDQVRYIEEDILKVKIQTEEFTDLLEDGLNQASRALSDERRQYIASLLKNSLSKDDLSHLNQKKLLSILNELNDVEIILLQYRSLMPWEEDEFWVQHENVVKAPFISDESPQEDADAYALFASYEFKLRQLGLLNEDARASDLGNLLLRYIDMKKAPE
jgi:hypothetical protein